MAADSPERVVVVAEHDDTIRIEAPGASDAELQAIVAAYRALWPSPVVQRQPDSTTWRFAGRWWVDSPLPRRRTVS